MAGVEVFLTLDAVSVLLAAIVSAFFLRSHRIWPQRSMGVLGGAFAFYALSHATASLAGFDVFDAAVLDAARTLGVTAAGLLVLTAYVFRWRRIPPPTMVVVAAALCLATLGAVAYYGLLQQSSFPSRVFPWLRLLDVFVLLAAAGLSTMGVHATKLAELRVPLAYVCLAFSRYSASMAAFAGHLEPNLANYAWRLAGLLLLASLAVTRWPRAPS